MKILVVDNYDSFTYNLLESFRLEKCELDVVYNSVSPKDIVIDQYDLLLLSPGPSRPENAGYLMEYIKAFKHKCPILGVCLGFQALVLEAGGTLGYLPTPVHGKISSINTKQLHLFNDLPQSIDVGRYHSIYAKHVPNEFHITSETDDGIPMSIEHTSLPIYGVQFHPESILSMKMNIGQKIVQNVLTAVRSRYVSDIA
mgnify:CR=1 FL=1